MWSLDRRVAAAAFVGAALALAIPIAVSDAPAPALAGSLARDRIARAEELAAVANRGARATWMVTFAFTRVTAAGRRLHDTIVVAHLASIDRPSLEVAQGLGSLVVTAGDRTYTCTVLRDQAQCLERPADGTSRPGDVYGGAVVSGRYDISGPRTARIAGFPARCFVLRLRTGVPVPGIGFSSEQCYSSDGVPLRSRVQRAGATDVRVALTVRRAVGRSELVLLLTPYGLERLVPAQ
jgi:hypothetical protein